MHITKQYGNHQKLVTIFIEKRRLKDQAFVHIPLTQFSTESYYKVNEFSLGIDPQ
jgi:hypothetical protein